MPSISKKYYAHFSCGHHAYVKYYNRSDLIKKLRIIEQGELCPTCKRKEFIKNAEVVEVPYGEYKEKYQNKRGIVAGKYNQKTRKITLYMTPKLSAKYKEEQNKVFYDAEKIGIDENGNHVISIFVKGNSFRLKNELKNLGYRFQNNRWQKIIVVFPNINAETGYKQLLPQNNPDFYESINELEKIGCINNIISLNL